jgi:hypothetical protein
VARPLAERFEKRRERQAGFLPPLATEQSLRPALGAAGHYAHALPLAPMRPTRDRHAADVYLNGLPIETGNVHGIPRGRRRVLREGGRRTVAFANRPSHELTAPDELVATATDGFPGRNLGYALARAIPKNDALADVDAEYCAGRTRNQIPECSGQDFAFSRRRRSRGERPRIGRTRPPATTCAPRNHTSPLMNRRPLPLGAARWLRLL